MTKQELYRLTHKQNNDIQNSGIKFGGGAFWQNNWPKNPLGEDLALLLTIDTNKLNNLIDYINLPKDKFLSIFSTYNPQRYFLDDIVFFGDEKELNYIKSGFTRVTISNQDILKKHNNIFESKDMKIEKTEIEESSFPSFSLVSKKYPKGLLGYKALEDEYRFICQVYSRDLPPYDGSALYLSDAIGYLFLRKNIIDENDAGIFFVQTA